MKLIRLAVVIVFLILVAGTFRFSSASSGDVNDDGQVIVFDALLVLQYAVGVHHPANETSNNNTLTMNEPDGGKDVYNRLIILGDWSISIWNIGRSYWKYEPPSYQTISFKSNGTFSQTLYNRGILDVMTYITGTYSLSDSIATGTVLTSSYSSDVGNVYIATMLLTNNGNTLIMLTSDGGRYVFDRYYNN